jgi:hypothetical protein
MQPRLTARESQASINAERETGYNMSMSKKDFIALADTIRKHNERNERVFGHNSGRMNFSPEEIETQADFCQSQNPNFKRERWLEYIAGKCGPSGGAVK